jgi:hypothetical protein
MPTISLPPRSELTSVPRGGQTDRPSSSLTMRAHVAAHRRSLTRELSEGANPASSPELSLRAQQLTTDHKRRLLARSLRRAVHEARHPAPRRVGFALVRRGALRRLVVVATAALEPASVS